MKRNRVLVNLIIIACTAIVIQGKAFPESPDELNYEGSVYNNRYWDPHSFKKGGQKNNYYTPIVDGRPIYVPPPGYSTKEINKILKEYYGSKELPKYEVTETPEDLVNYNHPVWNNMAQFTKTTESVDSDYESQLPLNDHFQGAYDKNYHDKGDHHHGDYHVLHPGHDQLKYQQNINENLDSENSYERPNVVHEKKISKFNYKIKNVENPDITDPYVPYIYDRPKIEHSAKLKHKLETEAPTKLVEKSIIPEYSDEQDMHGDKDKEDYDLLDELHNLGRTKHEEKHGTKKTKHPIKDKDTKVGTTTKKSKIKNKTKPEKSTIKPHIKVETNYYKSYLTKDGENYSKDQISTESGDEHKIPKTNVIWKHGDKINKKHSSKCPTGKTGNEKDCSENILVEVPDSEIESDKDVPSKIQYESLYPSYEIPEVVYVNKVGEINLDHLDKIKNPDVNSETDFYEETISTNEYEKPKIMSSVKVKGTIKHKPQKTTSTKGPKYSKITNKVHGSDTEWNEIPKETNESPPISDSYEAPQIAYVNKMGEMDDYLDEIRNADVKSEALTEESTSTNEYHEPKVVYSISVKSEIKNKPSMKIESTKAPKNKIKIHGSYTDLKEILSETYGSQLPDSYEVPTVVDVKKNEVENDQLENAKDPHIKKQTHPEKTPPKNTHEAPEIEVSTKAKDVNLKHLTKPKSTEHSMLENKNSLDVPDNSEFEKDFEHIDLKSIEKLDEIPDSEIGEAVTDIEESPNISFGAGTGEIEPFGNLGSGGLTEEDYEDPSPQFLDPDNSLFSMNRNLFSLIFNPKAQKHELKKCVTKANETGNCMYISECHIPNIATTLEQLLNNACVMDEVYIGVCCPEFPVETVQVDWEEIQPSSSEKKINDEFDHEDCGRKSVNESKAAYWPWKASLISMSNGKIFCSGVIIRDNYILTAAHCTTKISKNQILVRLGQNKELPGEDFAVIEIKRHAQYNPRTLNNDIALLKLARHVPFDENVGAVCIPDVDDDDDHVDEKGILLGWQGISKVNFDKIESLEIMSNKKCGEKLRRNIPESMLCTEARNTEERTCNADSGAALIVEDEDKYEVIGILSWNRNDCDPRFPSTFSRVPTYVRWIQKHAF